MFKYPVVPEDLTQISDADLEALRVGLQKALSVVTEGIVEATSKEDVDALGAATSALKAVKAEALSRKEAAAAHAAALEAAKAELQEEEPDPDEEEPEEDPDEVEEVEVEEEVEVVEEEAAAEEPEVKASATTKGGAVTRARTKPKAGVGSKAVQLSGKLKTGHFSAVDNVPDMKPGEYFTERGQLAEALLKRGADVSGSNRVPVARVLADYPEARILSDVPEANFGKFDALAGLEPDEELAATMCAPCTPYYNLSCMNSTRRPVFNSLPQFPAPRGCVSIYPSPSLSDITTGFGLWDNDDDTPPLSPKSTCQTIACANPVTYRIYGVYRCLTVQNLLQMTFPELVEAYLNRLAARTMRMAEVQLLDLMGTAVNTILATNSFFNASEQLSSQLLAYITTYAERQRWEYETFDVWLPRWLLNWLRIDIGRRRDTSGNSPRIGTEAQVSALLSDEGFTPHWYLDTPTWGVAAQTLGSGVAQIPNPPTHVKALVAPRGKFAIMDRGELRVGVTGDNIYRDNTSNSYNQFTMFFETFEGVVDTNSCPADIVDIPLCFSGVQRADDSAGCNGYRDEAS